MKTKIILLLAISAITTLSFTFASIHSGDKKQTEVSAVKNNPSEPVGGFMAEDEI